MEGIQRRTEPLQRLAVPLVSGATTSFSTLRVAAGEEFFDAPSPDCSRASSGTTNSWLSWLVGGRSARAHPYCSGFLCQETATLSRAHFQHAAPCRPTESRQYAVNKKLA